jgi:hypothetical protein
MVLQVQLRQLILIKMKDVHKKGFTYIIQNGGFPKRLQNVDPIHFRPQRP